jgi:hypothetical protein
MTAMIVTAGLSAWGILVLFACALCRAAGDADGRIESRPPGDGRCRASGIIPGNMSAPVGRLSLSPYTGVVRRRVCIA